MKAVTLTQPHATLVAIGAKGWETRGWKTNYRGPLAIHAAKGFPKDARQLCWEKPFFGELQQLGLHELNLPLGAVIAVVNLTDCKRIAVAGNAWEDYLNPLTLSLEELAFGDYNTGRYAWKLENVQRFNVPQPAKGALGLWEWTEGDTYTEDDRLDRMKVYPAYERKDGPMTELEPLGWDTAKEYGFIVGKDADLVRRIQKALGRIAESGSVDGAHHKQWVLDQVVRILTNEPGDYPENPRGYLKWRALQAAGEDGPHTYDWDEGIPP